MAKRINYRKLVFEFISISFAVLAALIVNQCRENHNEKKLSDKATEFIKLEIRDNKDVLTRFLNSHEGLLEKIDSIVALDNPDLKGFNFDIELTILSSSAWEMAEHTKAFYNKDLNDVNNITKIYNLQNYYQSIVKGYLLKNTLHSKDVQDQEKLHSNQQFLTTIIALEKDLIEFYALLLEEAFSEND